MLRWARQLCISATVLAVACASPTLPLPPPLAPSFGVSPDADHVQLDADCNSSEANSVIVVVNDARGADGGPSVPLDRAVGGALANACGGWDAVVYGHAGDPLDITYQLGAQTSLPTRVYVPTGLDVVDGGDGGP
jgi:hypothetical protein